MRSVFLASLITAAQRHLSCPSPLRISSSMAFLIAPGLALFLSSSPTLDVSIVQYSVSVILDGVVPIDVSVRRLLGQLFGGVRATSAYDGEGLDVWILDSWVWICSTIPAISSFNVSICWVTVLVIVSIWFSCILVRAS